MMSRSYRTSFRIAVCLIVASEMTGPVYFAGGDVNLYAYVANDPVNGVDPTGLICLDTLTCTCLRSPCTCAAIGGGTTMLTHCDFVYAGESAKFQMPFINLGLVPEFGSSCSLPAWLGHLRASELLLLGLPFGAARAAELGLVTRVVPDPNLLATATQTAQQLAAKPAGALQTCKKLLKRSAREQMERAMRVENEAYAVLLRSPDAREALTAFLEKRKPDFTKSNGSATAK